MPTPTSATFVVLGLLAELVDRTPESIEMDSDLNRELGIDSLHLLELLTTAERRMDVRLDLDQALAARTVAEVVDALASASRAA